jgi:hypothetical protein
MIKYVGEKFSVDVLKEYKESSPYIDMKSGTLAFVVEILRIRYMV